MPQQIKCLECGEISNLYPGQGNKPSCHFCGSGHIRLTVAVIRKGKITILNVEQKTLQNF